MTNLTRRFVARLAATLSALDYARTHCDDARLSRARCGRRRFRSIRRGRRIPTTGCSARSSSIAVDSRDHIWVLHRRAIDSRGSTRQRGASSPRVRYGGQAACELGRYRPTATTGRSASTASSSTRRTSSGSAATAAGRGRRRSGSGDDMILKFTDGREAGAADRTSRTEQGQYRHASTSTSPPTCSSTHRRTSCTSPTATATSASSSSTRTAGKFKRMWGAFWQRATGRDGSQPAGAAAQPGSTRRPAAVRSAVHAVKVSNDGIVYVADRTNNRIQPFTTARASISGPGAVIAAEGAVTPVPAGLCVLARREAAIPLRRGLRADAGRRSSIAQTMTQIGTVGMRGPKPGEFDIVHHMAADSKGNLYTAEIVTNRRASSKVLVSSGRRLR